MKYVVKVVDSTPEGNVTGQHYYIAETEHELEVYMNTFKEVCYTDVTCVGVIEKPTEHIRRKMNTYRYEHGLLGDNNEWLDRVTAEKRE